MSETHLDEILKLFIKPAWQLQLSKSSSATAATDVSKFGGLPYAQKHEVWPRCPTCLNELNFVAQLKYPGETALQTFFYCFECFPWESTDETRGQWLVRSYPVATMADYVAIHPAESGEYQMAACSCTAHPVHVLPDYQDLEALSPLAYALCEKIDAEAAYEVYEAAIARLACLEDFATLLGGYPKWVQNESVQTCNICQRKMEFFAQIDSESAADLMWGDCGLVYLFRCPEHKSEFKLELQCY